MSIFSFRFIVKNETKRIHDDLYEQGTMQRSRCAASMRVGHQSREGKEVSRLAKGEGGMEQQKDVHDSDYTQHFISL